MENDTYYNTLDQSTLDSLIEGYQLIGCDWRYLYVNDAVVKHSRYENKSDLLGYTMMEKYPGIEHTILFAKLKDCMENRSAKNIINEFTYKDNSKRWFELRIMSVPKGLFILSLDITEKVEIDTFKQDYLNALEDMMFMISHHVRQPICKILNISEIIHQNKARAEAIDGKIVDILKYEIEILDNLTKKLTALVHEKKITAKSSSMCLYEQDIASIFT